MPDDRSLVEKLMAMAMQDASPVERDIARAKLKDRGMWPLHGASKPGEPVKAGTGLWHTWSIEWLRRELDPETYDGAAGVAMLKVEAEQTAGRLGYEVKPGSGKVAFDQRYDGEIDAGYGPVAYMDDVIRVTFSVRGGPPPPPPKRDGQARERSWRSMG